MPYSISKTYHNDPLVQIQQAREPIISPQFHTILHKIKFSPKVCSSGIKCHLRAKLDLHCKASHLAEEKQIKLLYLGPGCATDRFAKFQSIFIYESTVSRAFDFSVRGACFSPRQVNDFWRARISPEWSCLPIYGQNLACFDWAEAVSVVFGSW